MNNVKRNPIKMLRYLLYKFPEEVAAQESYLSLNQTEKECWADAGVVTRWSNWCSLVFQELDKPVTAVIRRDSIVY